VRIAKVIGRARDVETLCGIALYCPPEQQHHGTSSGPAPSTQHPAPRNTSFAPRCAVSLLALAPIHPSSAACALQIGACLHIPRYAPTALRIAHPLSSIVKATPPHLRTPTTQQRIAHSTAHPTTPHHIDVECRHTTMSSTLALATATFLEHPIS
jgi:hypothetical protein